MIFGLCFLTALVSLSLAHTCDVCRNLVQQFADGYKKTERGLYEGGDTDWEVKNMVSYHKSEVRFIEITEGIFKSKQSALSTFLEDVEETLETWWRLHWDHAGDAKELDHFLCVLEKGLCCDYDFYGPTCERCDAGDGVACSGHGNCSGNGTRSGTGACICDGGYRGAFCGECKSGYVQAESGVCEDVDECAANLTICGEEPRKYCLNSAGYYSCKPCDESCEKCSGPGASDCVECREGYQMGDSGCQLPEEKGEGEVDQISGNIPEEEAFENERDVAEINPREEFRGNVLDAGEKSDL